MFNVDVKETHNHLKSKINLPKIDLTPIININLNNDDQSSENGTQSAVWNLLESNKSKTFQITPPNFNVFEQKKKHWLERPPVSWEKMNVSHVKCTKWLNQEF